MNKGISGFTIIELIVSIAIFAFMTALVVSKYGTFNQNTLLVNVAYDMALTVRTAQSYGLSVKSVDGSSNVFTAPYGVHFDVTSNPTSNNKFTLFVDKPQKGFYDSSDPTEAITTYTLNSGAYISKICLGTVDSNCSVLGDLKLDSSNTGDIDITYRRPNPDAYFCNGGHPGLLTCPSFSSKPIVFITVTSADKTNSQNVVIRKNGQISVEN